MKLPLSLHLFKFVNIIFCSRKNSLYISYLAGTPSAPILSLMKSLIAVSALFRKSFLSQISFCKALISLGISSLEGIVNLLAPKRSHTLSNLL